MKITEEMEKKGIKKIREHFGIKDGGSLGGNSDERISRVSVKEAEFFPTVPSYWKESKLSIYSILTDDAEDYIKIYEFNGLRVIVSAMKYDGNEWLHVSFSRKSRIPDYKDIQLVRKDFIGTDKKSIMVFPDEEHYVNFATTCLHLWYSKTNPIPDFDIEIEGLGRMI